MDDQPKETEAKFLVESPAAWGRIGSLRGIGALKRVGSARERQRNVYWDTSDFRLRRAHAALKLRQVGSRAELTFKRELAYVGGVSQRIEITVPVRARELQRLLSDPRANAAVRCARKIVGARPLREVLTLRTLRRKALFAPARATKARRCLELAQDQVCVERGAGVLSTHREVELENRGLPESLFRQAVAGFRREFAGGVRLCRKSKYELGLAVLRKKKGER